MDQATFADLPDALVRDLLRQAEPMARTVANELGAMSQARQQMREQARSANLIRRKADLEVTREPSVAGVDGSYQVHHLTAFDLCATAAVAIEGTIKEERRHWREPYHDMWTQCLPHELDTVGALRALMVAMELKLATDAPHDLVLLDGSYSSLIIYLNQGLSKVEDCGEQLRKELLRRWGQETLTQLKHVLQSDRTIAMPKFTSRNELTRDGYLRPPRPIDGKTLATMTLEPFEYTTPLPLNDASDTAAAVDHLPLKYCPKEDLEEIRSALGRIRVVYFRPFAWLPALRLELPGAMAASPQRLAMVLEGITRQFATPAVGEPYPLFLADRMVKSLGAGVAAIEQHVAQYVTGSISDVETTMICLMNYRTQGGRGGV
jgi:NurA domain